nr:MAG: hypothetical protein [Molluscum contagiosum virus]
MPSTTSPSAPFARTSRSTTCWWAATTRSCWQTCSTRSCLARSARWQASWRATRRWAATA